MKYIAAQILGGVGYSLLGFSFFKKKKKQILFIQLFAYAGFTSHYFLLGALTGTICNILGFFALILIYLVGENEKKKKILVTSILVLLMFMAYFSYENIFSLFPVIACLVTFNSFLSKDENKIRFIGIISAECWLIYAVIIRSPVAIFFETILVIATIIAYIKNKKKKTK